MNEKIPFCALLATGLLLMKESILLFKKLFKIFFLYISKCRSVFVAKLHLIIVLRIRD